MLSGILHIERALVSISANQDIFHPARSEAHFAADSINWCVQRAFDDQFVMDMAADQLIGEGAHGEHQKISGDGLHDIFYKFRTVGFDTFPFFGGSDTFIGDGFSAEAIFADAGLYITELPAGR